MKTIALLLLACLVATGTFSQTTGRIEGLKDAWGVSYNYVGEIKNKQPNGVGVAIYTGGNTVRYAGGFVNGIFTGKGAILFTDGTFLSGDWKNGKLNGKGTDLNTSGDIYVGEFIDGKRNGKGTFVYKDKSFLTGSMKNDTYEGRCIFVNATGTTLADNIYSNGKKNGTGYQYELDTKKLFEGTWSNGDWVSSGTASYNSFLKDSRFYSEKTNDQVIIGCLNANKRLEDTSFFYDLKNAKRYFGYCTDGYLADGIIVRDSTVFFGKSGTNGAHGNCSLYKLSKYYDEGNYVNDLLEGDNAMSIDLDRKTVYYGGTKKGFFTGKAWFVNRFNEVHNGYFESGKFTGDGYIVYNTGKTVKGTFDDGLAVKVVSFTDENGASIDMKPKSFETALNLVVGELNNDLVVFKGPEDTTLYGDDYYSAEKSFVSFPGSAGSNFVFEDFAFYIGYCADFYIGKSFQSAKAAYEKLCNDIAASNIHLKGSVPFRPGGTIEAAKETGTTRTKFSLPGSDLSAYSVYAELKNESGNYTVRMVAGDVVYDDDKK